MDRINTKGTIEIDGKRMFYDGDPHSEPTKPATVLNASWLNGFQESICYLIESQEIQLKDGDYTTLKTAVTRMITDKTNQIEASIEAMELEMKTQFEELKTLIKDQSQTLRSNHTQTTESLNEQKVWSEITEQYFKHLAKGINQIGKENKDYKPIDLSDIKL